MANLRHIAVHVEEPKPGRFAWVLSERGAQEWQQLDRSESVAASYQQAMADGLLALQALVPDLNVGPRHIDEPAAPQEDGSSPGDETDPVANRHQRGGEGTPGSGKSYFGFGPVR